MTIAADQPLFDLQPFTGPAKLLADRYIAPPFSILNTQQGDWQNRKRAWIALGLQGELGRHGNLGNYNPKHNADFGYYTHLEQDKARQQAEAEIGAKRSVGRGSELYETMGARSAGKPFGGAYNDILPSRLNPEARKEYEGGKAFVNEKINTDFHVYRVKEGTKAAKVFNTEGNIAQQHTGTSVFDPVLCEIAYTWFTAPGDQVFDPFAGGATRGIVAVILGREYVGIDLRPEQAAANEQQAAAILPAGDHRPRWVVGDAYEAADLLRETCEPRFLFSCPPYGDLEVYSDDPRDLSNMPADKFAARYRSIISASVSLLQPDSFACFVVGNYRGADGNYIDLVGMTVDGFVRAGCRLYNDLVLMNAYGTAPMRAAGQFAGNRKVVKVHQNVLVFVKGSWQRACERIAGVGGVPADGSR